MKEISIKISFFFIMIIDDIKKLVKINLRKQRNMRLEETLPGKLLHISFLALLGWRPLVFDFLCWLDDKTWLPQRSVDTGIPWQPRGILMLSLYDTVNWLLHIRPQKTESIILNKMFYSKYLFKQVSWHVE